MSAKRQPPTRFNDYESERKSSVDSQMDADEFVNRNCRFFDGEPAENESLESFEKIADEEFNSGSSNSSAKQTL